MSMSVLGIVFVVGKYCSYTILLREGKMKRSQAQP